ncbi:MAG TPA: hypothetical protein VHO67_02170 [Polyangia bacterium]|nr:hypothetical protein [Polyangia bacterium]
MPFDSSAAHTPPLQNCPLLQVVPLQQTCPDAPQAQVPPEQVRLAPHLELLQQGCPLAPHATQVAPEQTVPEAVQLLLAQQGWLSPPQLPQVPLEPQTVPPAEQLPPTPPQHGCPLPPQLQVPPEQVRLAPHELPEQHGWPLPPQAEQLPEVLQNAPLLQLEPLQHG